MEYKIAICDDDIYYSNLVEEKIMRYYEIHNSNKCILNVFNNAEELIKTSSCYDIIFLDIEMPTLSGIEIKNQLEKKGYNGNIIFISNYEQYMNEAFGKNVIAYIQKDKIDRIDAVLKNIDVIEEGNKILKISEVMIKINDIYYIKSNGGYCTIYTKEDSYMFCINLIDIINRINNDCFMIVHRSYIINFKYIRSFDSSEILLINNYKVKISRKYKDQFKKRYFNYLKGL